MDEGAAGSGGTRTVPTMCIMDAPARMLATETKALLEAPLTLILLPDLDKERLCPSSKVAKEIDLDLGTSDVGCGASRMWY